MITFNGKLPLYDEDGNLIIDNYSNEEDQGELEGEDHNEH